MLTAGITISSFCLGKWLAHQCWAQIARFLFQGFFPMAICLYISPGLCMKPQNLASLLLPPWFPPSYYRPLSHGNKKYQWPWVLNRVTNHHQSCPSLSATWHSRLFVDRDHSFWSTADRRLMGSSYRTTSVQCLWLTWFVWVASTRWGKRRKSFQLQAHQFLRLGHHSQKSLPTLVRRFCHCHLRHLVDFTPAKLAFCFCNTKTLGTKEIRWGCSSFQEQTQASLSASGGCITVCRRPNES